MTKLYNADEVTLSVGGKLIDSGWATGEFISIEEQAPRINSEVGTDGEATVSREMNRSAVVTVKLSSTSDGNDVFQDMADSNENGPGLPGIKSLFIRDRNGRSKHQGDCLVQSVPPVSYDRGRTVREWKLFVPRMKNAVRGNNDTA